MNESLPGSDLLYGQSYQTLAAAYLPADFRHFIEQEYYQRVTEQSRLENLIDDPEFLADPGRHVAFYSDHGVVHARDTATKLLRVLSLADGVLTARRAPSRTRFMAGFGFAIAYLHDIGMRNVSKFGRDMHPEFAAQEVFRPEFDRWIDTLWADNWGNMAWRLERLSASGALSAPPKVALRELLSMAMAHSKTKMPMSVLNNRARLRARMVQAVGSDMTLLYRAEQKERAWNALQRATQDGGAEDRSALAATLAQAETELAACENAHLGRTNPFVERLYDDFSRDAYAWLTDARGEPLTLADDAVDTARCLRCADALRQRGTVLKTSAEYQIFVDQASASAVYAIRDETGSIYMVETGSVNGAGEANIAAMELTERGDMRIGFHHGAFRAPHVADRAALHAAMIVVDAQHDILESFAEDAPKPLADRLVLIEDAEDSLKFADLVREQIARLEPAIAPRVRVAPSLASAPEHERQRYLAGAPVVLGDAICRTEFTENLAASGFNTRAFDIDTALEHVRQTRLRPGDVLVEAGKPAAFVYLPLSHGLKGFPLGGYSPFTVRGWVPMNVGVIRGACYNSTVVADLAVDVLIIPRDSYLRHWHRTFDLDEFADLLRKRRVLSERG